MLPEVGNKVDEDFALETYQFLACSHTKTPIPTAKLNSAIQQQLLPSPSTPPLALLPRDYPHRPWASLQQVLLFLDMTKLPRVLPLILPPFCLLFLSSLNPRPKLSRVPRFL
jgi:hypothetical protein